MGKLFVPTITPLNADLSCDVAALDMLCKAALADGAEGIVLFGTLGEGQSFSVAERRTILEGLLAAGTPAEKLVVGTGAAALPDMVELTRHALAQGVERSLVIAPFFFKGVSDQGIEAALSQVIDAVDDSRMRVTLYDIPSVVGVAIAPKVIRSLRDRHGPVIAALKDSVGDWGHVHNSIASFPDLEVFVGNEIFLPQALAMGGAGAISGHGNFATRQLAALSAGAEGSDAIFAAVETLYHAVARHPVVPMVKALAGYRHGQPGFARVRAPLVAVEPAPEVVAALDALRAIAA
ncbi:4-hydroxy-tetrahydrodipicolinate synthase [Devosia enhydra]|uniref:4-hydroxy-tetrahydrodipicolinate synthase n=1 Tax=Devosia enhydra TaxID=665118 RepID=A0A1K2HTQ6_9HYPH|nr:dihydrodipicolinate synthase family protein [Devosia enhydra]SFZ80718.1 4-hydroxy-tetrahydrodipicolinate synthase [Devosia enhydra]